MVALLRSPKKASLLPQGTETFTGDLSSFADEATRLPECDVVIHLAGVVAADRPDDYDSINFVAVKNLAACLSRQAWAPRRVLFASSLAAAGPSPRDVPWTESDALHPIDAYGVAKAKAETAFASSPWPTTIFRPPIVFGPLDTATLTLFKAARTGLGFRVAGAPQRLSFVDVRDLVDAILLMAGDGRSGSFTYYTSHPDAFDVVELWSELGVALGRSVRVLPVPQSMLYTAMVGSTGISRLFGVRNQLDRKQFDQMIAPAFLCSGNRLERDLGWRPRHTLPDSLAHAARGYREAGWL